MDAQYHFCPGFFLNLSESKPESGDPTRSKVDGSFIPNEDRSLITPGVPNWAYQWFSLEFKRGGTENDPFDDRHPFAPETATATRRSVRGQLFGYVDLIFKYQHRTSHFELLFNGSQYRATRWDRSGVITTKATEYAETADHTRALLQLLYGLSQMSAADAGFDPTAVRLSRTSCGWNRMRHMSFDNPNDFDEAECDWAIRDTDFVCRKLLGWSVAAAANSFGGNRPPNCSGTRNGTERDILRRRSFIIQRTLAPPFNALLSSTSTPLRSVHPVDHMANA